MAHILVVDDDPDIVELVSLKLRAGGHEVTVAGSGEAARDVLASRRDVDLAVVDHMMPGMTGQARDLANGPTAGLDRSLTTPRSPRELAARVGAMLARR